MHVTWHLIINYLNIGGERSSAFWCCVGSVYTQYWSTVLSVSLVRDFGKNWYQVKLSVGGCICGIDMAIAPIECDCECEWLHCWDQLVQCLLAMIPSEVECEWLHLWHRHGHCTNRMWLRVWMIALLRSTGSMSACNGTKWSWVWVDAFMASMLFWHGRIQFTSLCMHGYDS